MGPLIPVRGVAPPEAIADGFTLVEIAVVLLILAIGATLAFPVLSPSPSRTLEHDAVRLAGTIEQAARTAIFRGREIGVGVDSGSVRVFERESASDRWMALAGDDSGLVMLAAGVGVEAIDYGGVRLPAGTILVLRPSGRNPPIRIALTHSGLTATVVSDPLNRVRVDLPGHAP